MIRLLFSPYAFARCFIALGFGRRFNLSFRDVIFGVFCYRCRFVAVCVWLGHENGCIRRCMWHVFNHEQCSLVRCILGFVDVADAVLSVVELFIGVVLSACDVLVNVR